MCPLTLEETLESRSSRFGTLHGSGNTKTESGRGCTGEFWGADLPQQNDPSRILFVTCVGLDAT